MEGSVRELPMFPLGATVFPAQVVPLHVFEPRYRALVRDLLDGDSRSFGIALIDRGHEVGGDDHRVDVGTRVDLVHAEEFDDGRWAIAAVGIERIEVDRWLPDDPYPRALVRSRSRTDTGGGALDEVADVLAETFAVGAAVAGVAAPELPELSDNPLLRLDQLSAIAPLGTFDRQRILEAETTTRQVDLLRDALRDRLVVLRAELDHRDDG